MKNYQNGPTSCRKTQQDRARKRRVWLDLFRHPGATKEQASAECGTTWPAVAHAWFQIPAFSWEFRFVRYSKMYPKQSDVRRKQDSGLLKVVQESDARANLLELGAPPPGACTDLPEGGDAPPAVLAMLAAARASQPAPIVTEVPAAAGGFDL